MRYTVIWKGEAERRLAALWMNAADRKALADAANRIDVLLSIAPENQGESRDSSRRRILLDPPLGVVFNVLPDAHTVLVLAVWAI